MRSTPQGCKAFPGCSSGLQALASQPSTKEHGLSKQPVLDIFQRTDVPPSRARKVQQHQAVRQVCPSQAHLP